MKTYYILMADIIGSKEVHLDAYQSFKQAVNEINQSHSTKLLSPLTVTLGDEFQGVVRNKKSGIEIIIAVEEKMLALGIRLRYAFEQGEVETALNPDHAHEMIGPGLTKTRKDLEELKKTDDRFVFHFKDALQTQKLNFAFRIYGSIVDNWYVREGDAGLAHDFLELKDYKKVAEKHQKDDSSMWRKEKSLKLRNYQAIKNLIYLLIGAKIGD